MAIRLCCPFARYRPDNEYTVVQGLLVDVVSGLEKVQKIYSSIMKSEFPTREDLQEDVSIIEKAIDLVCHYVQINDRTKTQNPMLSYQSHQILYFFCLIFNLNHHEIPVFSGIAACKYAQRDATEKGVFGLMQVLAFIHRIGNDKEQLRKIALEGSEEEIDQLFPTDPDIAMMLGSMHGHEEIVKKGCAATYSLDRSYVFQIALNVAIERNHEGIVDLLLSELPLSHKENAYLLMIRFGHINMIRKYSPDISQSCKEQALIEACAKGHAFSLDLVREGVSYPSLQEAFFAAARYGHVELVRAFLQIKFIQYQDINNMALAALLTNQIEVFNELYPIINWYPDRLKVPTLIQCMTHAILWGRVEVVRILNMRWDIPWEAKQRAYTEMLHNPQVHMDASRAIGQILGVSGFNGLLNYYRA